MSEVVLIKDSAAAAIKLFGRTISLTRHTNNNVVSSSANDEPAPSSSSSFPREVSSTPEQYEAQSDKELSRKELTSTQDEASHQTPEEPKSPTTSSCNPKTPSTERETSLMKSSKNNNGDQSDTTTTSVSQDNNNNKTLKKPDKVLPCPRCNSMDTKFCYYNNYNVNQPRYFCKHCQRYWTAGGTMRNVPVGAGRRKNKNSSCVSSHYRQIMVPEALHSTAVLTFGSSDSPLCDSMASVLSLADNTQNGVVLNGDEYDTVMSEKRDIAATTNSNEESLMDDNKSYQLCFPGSSSSSSPWPYPWNPSMTPSAFCHPVPFYWGCMPPPPSWSVNYQSAPASGPNSPTLGKHSRDGDILFQKHGSTDMAAENNNNKNSVLIPKTLRIDDPTEAAKSSIWSTLGIKNEKGNGLFKAFASKGGDSDDKNNNNHVKSPVLQANPAALSRSLVFHERT